MTFTPTARVRELLPRIAAFLRDHAAPLERSMGGRTFKELLPEIAVARAKVKELGMWAPWLGADHGGMGLTLTEYAYVSEALGRSPLGHYLFHCQAPDVGNLEILALHGTAEQKERWLGPLARGEIRSCFSMTEPENAGSNPVLMDTTARLDGDTWVIDGHKWFTSSADGAAFAIVMAVTQPAAGKYQQASMIIVPLPHPGVTLVRNVSVMGEAGSDWASHGELRYTGARVPRANLLGADGAGFVIAQERLGPGRIHHCMRWIGIAERAFEMMCERAAKRMIAPGRPLGTRQMVQEWIAESRAEINASRLMVLAAAHKIDTEGTYAAREEISCIKFYVANVLGRVLDRAIQTHGALGVTDDTPLAFWYRHERSARIYDGADEVHKASVAKRILRKYGLEVSG